MSKPLLIFIICASLVLTLTLRLRTSYIVQPNPYVRSQQRRQLVRWDKKARRKRIMTTKMNIDPRTVDLKDDITPQSIMQPLHVCERAAPIPHDEDMKFMQEYASCSSLNKPPEETTLLVLDEMQTFGRTGNNLIEFLHSFQYAKDHDVVLAIKRGTWVTHLLPIMWMAIQDHDMDAWIDFVEKAFCVKIFRDYDDLTQYKKIIHMETRDLFLYRYKGDDLNSYVESTGQIIRILWRSYNKGVGLSMRQKPVGDMCSVLEAIFGSEKHSAVYSVVHSRTMEGDPGLRLLGQIANRSGCDPVAALNMEPEYVKAILAPLGMLDHPILFITDQQRPEILEKLLADPEIGPNIRLIPDEASWVGGDITVAVMANVFIGLPASTFSGFIAKSRVALGFDATYLFRKKNKAGEWVDACDEHCIFDKHVMRSMA